MFRDDDENSKKWNEDLHEYEKKKVSTEKPESKKPKNKVSEKGPKLIIIGVCVSVFIYFVISIMLNIGPTNSTLETYSTSDISRGETLMEVIPYGLNQPIEILNDEGINTGSISVTSARMIMASEPTLEVTYEIIKHAKDFYPRIYPYTFEGDPYNNFFELDELRLEPTFLSYSASESLNIKESYVDWSAQEAEIPVTVTEYYKYRPLKAHFGIYISTFIEGTEVAATVDFNPLVENKTIDLSVVKQSPVDQQFNKKVPMKQAAQVQLIEIKVNKMKYGKGNELFYKKDYLYNNAYYIAINVDITNNSAVESDFDTVFKLYAEGSWKEVEVESEYDHYIWGDPLKISKDPLILKPGENVNATFVYYLKTKPEDKLDYYLVYNPDYLKFDELTKFSIPIK